MTDFVGLVVTIVEICTRASDKLQEVKDIEKDCRELRGLLDRVAALLRDVPLALVKQQLKNRSAIRALEALHSTVELCYTTVTELSNKSKISKFLFSADYISKIKGITAKMALDLSTFQTALGMEHHADLREATRQLQEDLRSVSLEVMRGFQDQAAQFRRELELVQHALLASGLESSAALEERIRATVLASLQKAGVLNSTNGITLKEADEVSTALQGELECLRREKRAMDEECLLQIIAALSLSAPAHASCSAGCGGGIGGGGGGGGSRSTSTGGAAAAAPIPPDDLTCPILKTLMKDPVILVDSGHSFERTAIERHLSTSNINPMTNLRLATKAMVPNINLRNAIESWLHQQGLTHDSMEDRTEKAPTSWKDKNAREREQNRKRDDSNDDCKGEGKLKVKAGGLMSMCSDAYKQIVRRTSGSKPPKADEGKRSGARSSSGGGGGGSASSSGCTTNPDAGAKNARAGIGARIRKDGKQKGKHDFSPSPTKGWLGKVTTKLQQPAQMAYAFPGLPHTRHPGLAREDSSSSVDDDEAAKVQVSGSSSEGERWRCGITKASCGATEQVPSSDDDE